MFAEALLLVDFVYWFMTGMTADDEVDPATVARQLCERAERTKRRQVAVAAEKLDDPDSDELDALCERLTARILAGPLAALEVAADHDDPELARAVTTLFAIEGRDGSVETTEDDAREALVPVDQ